MHYQKKRRFQNLSWEIAISKNLVSCLLKTWSMYDIVRGGGVPAAHKEGTMSGIIDFHEDIQEEPNKRGVLLVTSIGYGTYTYVAVVWTPDYRVWQTGQTRWGRKLLEEGHCHSTANCNAKAFLQKTPEKLLMSPTPPIYIMWLKSFSIEHTIAYSHHSRIPGDLILPWLDTYKSSSVNPVKWFSWWSVMTLHMNQWHDVYNH